MSLCRLTVNPSLNPRYAPRFMEPRKLVFVITRWNHLNLSWPGLIECKSILFITLKYILMLYCYLRLVLLGCLVHSVVSTKIVCSFLIFPMRAACTSRLLYVHFPYGASVLNVLCITMGAFGTSVHCSSYLRCTICALLCYRMSAEMAKNTLHLSEAAFEVVDRRWERGEQAPLGYSL